MHCTRRAPELSATSRLLSALRRSGSSRFGRNVDFREEVLAVPLDHHPGLALADRRAFLDPHHVAGLANVVRIVRGILLRTPDELLVEGVHHATLDQNRNGLVHLIADHSP
jgi:hypothetical protein